MRYALGKLWSAFFVAVLLFVAVALVVGGIRATADCFTCGAAFGETLWIMGFSAHQPVLWTRDLSFRRRLAIWTAAVVAGCATYVLLDALAAALIGAGSVGNGLQLGLGASAVAVLVALGSSIALVRLTRTRR